MQTKINLSPEDRQNAYERMFFNIGEFGKLATPQIAYKSYCSLHEQIFDILYRKPERAAIIAPRGFSKTSTASTIGTLHDIAFDLERFVIIIKKTETQAIKDLRAIKAVMKYGEHFKYFFGEYDFEKDTEHEIIIRHRSTGHRMSILALGTGQEIRGAMWENVRPTKILLDDFESRKNTTTSEMRAENRKWFSEDTEPALHTEGSLIAIGNIVHYDTILWSVKQAYDNGNRDWEVIYRQAIENGESIWPDMWPLSKLERVRRSYENRGLLAAFYQEYMNIPIPDEQRVFLGIKYFDGELKQQDGYWVLEEDDNGRLVDTAE